jgi:large subunit ribosomal protein L25
MEFVDLKVERRTGTGKSIARKLRQRGRIPAIVYGEGEPIPVAADPKSLLKALRTEAGENVILNLTIVDTEEVTRKAMVKGVQVDPVTGIMLHADFLAISMERPIEVEVPVELVGVARGVKEEGGIVEQILRELTMKCLPSAIPDSIQLDISTLGMGDVVHVKDLAIPGGVELLTDREQVVVTVAAAPVEEVAVPVAAEAVAPEAAEAPPKEGAARETAKPAATKEAGKPGAAAEAPGKPSAKTRPEKE